MRLIALSVFASLPLLYAQQGAPENDTNLPLPLQSGASTGFSLPAVSAPALLTGNFSYQIKVPEGATRLEINLSSEYEVDLYVRFGKQVTYADDGGVVADYRSEGVGGNESIVITGSPMPSGTYYVAFKVWTVGVATSGYLVATATVGCHYGFETSEASVTSAGGAGSISVLSTPACAWTAGPSASWITITSHGSGISSGLVGYQVAPNPGAARIGVITIGGQIFTIRQAGVGAVLVPDNALLISQFVAGGGQWSMDIFVTNVSSSNEGFTMSFYNADGTPRTMPIAGTGLAGSITRSLASGETQLIQTGGAEALQQGWAVVVPNSSASRLSGFAVFRQTLATGSSEAIVPFMDPKQSRYVLLFDNASGFVTGAALANPNSTQTLTITATARDPNGQALGGPVLIVLPPLGRTTFVVSERFPGTDKQRGSIYLSGSAGFTGLGLRFSPQATFTSFPLVTTADIQ